MFPALWSAQHKSNWKALFILVNLDTSQFPMHSSKQQAGFKAYKAGSMSYMLYTFIWVLILAHYLENVYIDCCMSKQHRQSSFFNLTLYDLHSLSVKRMEGSFTLLISTMAEIMNGCIVNNSIVRSIHS